MIKQFVLPFIFIPLFLAAEEPKAVYNEHYLKGMAYYKVNDPEKAGAEFLKALETDNDDKESKKMLEILKREAFREEPDAAFKDVVKELYIKGLAYYRAGENEKALTEWEKGLSLAPKNKQLLEFRDLINAGSARKPETATGKKEAVPVKKEVQVKKTAVQKEKAASLKSKINVDEKKVSDLYYEGLKLYKQGELKKAIEIWEQVLKLDPDLSKARKNLERAKKELAQGE